MFNMGEDLMKQWTQNWEKLMGDHLEKMVNNEKFISEMSKTIAATMTGKAFYTKIMDEQMAALNIPTRTDTVRIMQQLTDIEERLIVLSEKLEDYQEAHQAMHASEKTAAKKKASSAGRTAATKKASSAGRTAATKKASTAGKTAATKKASSAGKAAGRASKPEKK